MNKKLLLAILACGVISAGFLIYGPVQAVSLNFPNLYQISFTGTNTNPDADLDGSGNVYVVYERGGSIYYKMNRGAEQLAAVGTDSDLAVDSAGNAHMAYLSGSDVMYTKLVAGVWSAPATVAAGNYATIDTDSSNYAYIAYSVIGGDGYSDVFYATNAAGVFASTIIKDGSLVAGVLDENYTTPNIKIDTNGKYHIAFIYTNNAGTGESYVQIETDAADGDSTSASFAADSVSLGKNSLALDGSNSAYIAFARTPLSIKYAKVTTSFTWTETTIISLLAGGGIEPAIAVNGATIDVAYNSGGNVKYKEDSGAGFGAAETIDAGLNPAALLGSHFAYYEKSGNIWLATDQSIADTNLPVVSGVAEGGLYNTSKIITFTDDEAVPTATLDGAAFASGDAVLADGAHTLIVTDGINSVTVNFTIDATAPVITGVSDGSTYTSAIASIDFADGAGSGIATATLNGSAFISGAGVSTNGAYTLIVTDNAGNAATVAFTIAIPVTVTPPPATGGGGGGGGPVDPTIYAYNQSLALDGARPGVLTWNFNPSVTAKLEVPVGAVAASTVFKIETAPVNEYGLPVSSLGAILIGNQAFKITAYDANNLPVAGFLKPLKITLTIDGIKVNLTDLGAYYFDAQTAQWLKLSDAVFDQINGAVVFSTDYLGIFAVYKVAGTPATLATTAIPVVPGQVLGATYCGNDYKNGDLIRNTVDKKIYVLINGYKSHITSLTELRAKYAGQVIYNVSPEAIACYQDYTGQVLGASYAALLPNGSLIRNSVNFRIYVVKDGKKLYIPTLDELRAHYVGLKINNLAPAEIDLYQNY
ncbi:MAG: hypothetical protein A3J65_02950 [Candidatus Buchananbacteria bacterium RIFCSPHIGHO2_02_FULL_45_11b]|uniref:HYR domain-containing protein n=1 Tax=Candidatus Buchananbacteria bacterium RIFCSPHIGHO2_02_FULL_45_11b TaxID=1797541 RepID=A0A1G1YIZ7_9BACT|nr:MAG: hypothetical protein A3J65_02950 [Candidatus Buchananbacteria bacterium RIFCSPHIGHO2_02_FULL_45_11b]